MTPASRRLLLDQNMPPALVELLAEQGWDVEHVSQLGLARAPDRDVLAAARAGDRVLVSADTDFGGLLALSGAASPSVVLVRRVSSRRSADLAVLLRANLPLVAADLAAGAVVVLGDDTLRVRRLPLV